MRKIFFSIFICIPPFYSKSEPGKIKILPSDVLFVVCKNNKIVKLPNKFIQSVLKPTIISKEDIAKVIKQENICPKGHEYLILNRKIKIN